MLPAPGRFARAASKQAAPAPAPPAKLPGRTRPRHPPRGTPARRVHLSLSPDVSGRQSSATSPHPPLPLPTPKARQESARDSSMEKVGAQQSDGDDKRTNTYSFAQVPRRDGINDDYMKKDDKLVSPGSLQRAYHQLCMQISSHR